MVILMVRIKDVALKCGLSIASVSKALSGKSDLNPKTVEYICQVAKEMGYIPNATARALKTNRSYNIGILFVDDTCFLILLTTSYPASKSTPDEPYALDPIFNSS